MKIRWHPLFLLVIVSGFITGMIAELGLLFLIVFLHEMSHVAAARALGYRVLEITVLPFGGVARLEHGSFGWNPRHETLIAIAGPVSNFLLVGLLYVVEAFFPIETLMIPESWKSFYLIGNLTIAFFNLLPALPLDGGRILRAVLSNKYGFKRSTEVGIQMAIIVSVVLLVFGIASIIMGYGQAGMVALAFFLLVSAWQLRKKLQYDTIRFLDAKRRQWLSSKGLPAPLPVRTLVASPWMSLLEVMSQFSPDHYHVILIIGDAQGEHRITEEALLYEAFSGRGVQSRLADLLVDR